jgi:alkyl hydroperoxide reductase subunit AhpC
MLQIGQVAPDFEAATTQGRMRFHAWLGDSWGVLFSHPKDFTPVCTTELGYLASLKPEFERRNAKVVGLSVDPVEDHGRWIEDIRKVTGHTPDYPIIGDVDLKVAKLYGMLPAEAGDTAQGRTAADNQTVRTVYVIGPDKLVKAMVSYPMSTGRNFDEILRLIDSCQLTARHKVATPVNWKHGEPVIIVPSLSDDEARQRFPNGWEARTPYMRVVPQPTS